MAAKSGGKRAGARRGARPKRRFRPRVLAYAVAITALVIGWGYLVWAAIDFGVDARGGDSRAWGFLGLAALGAAACLFAGLMIIARLMRALGGVAEPRSDGTAAIVPRTVGSLGRADSTPGRIHTSVDSRIDTSSVVGPGGPPTSGHVRETRAPRAQRHPQPPGPARRHRAG